MATYEAMLIGDVVRQLELMKRDGLLHPLLSGDRRFGVYVHALGHVRIGFAGHHPSAVVKLVATVVGADDVH